MQTMKTLYNITKMLSNEKPKRSAGIFDEKKKTYHKLYRTARKMETAPEHPVDVEETDEICENHLRRTIHTSDQKCN